MSIIFGLLLPLFCVCLPAYLQAHGGATAFHDRDSAAGYQSDKSGDDGITSLKLEMRKLRDELATMRKDYDSKLQERLLGLEVQVGDVAKAADRSLHETNQRLITVNSLVDSVALDLRETKRFFISTIHDLKTDFEKGASANSEKLNVSSQLEDLHQSILNLEGQMTTSNTQMSTFGLRLRSLETNCDLSIQGLNISLQSLKSEIKVPTLVNESTAIKNLGVGNSTINSTLNRLLGLQENRQGPETEPSQNMPSSFSSRSEPLKLMTSAELPMPKAWAAAVYDGKDSIYIIGGYPFWGTEKILRYSLQTWKVETNTSFMHIKGNCAIMDGEDIVTFGGDVTVKSNGTEGVFAHAKVYRISPKNSNYSQVGSLPQDASSMGVAWDSLSRTAYLFGGRPFATDYILSYNASTNQINRIWSLQNERSHVTASWDSKRRVAHVFSAYPNDTLQFAPPDNIKSYEPLPHYLGNPCSVYARANDRVYVVGGHGKLIKYNPTDHTSTEVDVVPWPEYWNGAACVYVAKEHRMYMIGGYAKDHTDNSDNIGSYRREIKFINLDWP